MNKNKFYKSSYSDKLCGFFWTNKEGKAHIFNKFGYTNLNFDFCHSNFMRYYVDIIYYKPIKDDVLEINKNIPTSNIDFTLDSKNILLSESLKLKFINNIKYLTNNENQSYTAFNDDYVTFYGNNQTLTFMKTDTENKIIWYNGNKCKLWDSDHKFKIGVGKNTLDYNSFIYMIEHYLDKFYNEKNKYLNTLIEEK